MFKKATTQKKCYITDPHHTLEEYPKMMEELLYKTHFDTLTDIYNRQTFFDATRELLDRSPDKNYVISCFDIERFKFINDLYGTECGDAILRYIADTLKKILPADSTFGRKSDDVFLMCFPFQTGSAKKVVQKIEKALAVYPLDFRIIAFFGFFIVNSDRALPINLMCDRAKLALGTVKGNYMRRYAFYNTRIRDRFMRDHEIIFEMNAALKEKQFKVWLQPKYSITNAQLIGAEALVRWEHPQKGMIPPNDFIPLFERNGFIIKMDYAIWEQTCALIAHWIDTGHPLVPISVNISRIDFYDSKLVKKIIHLVEKYHIPVNLLELEITESAYTDNPQQLLTVMKHLQNYGFKILMDDFGSGYSSLNMLKDVPVDILKIDMNFLSEAKLSGRTGNILSSIVRLAKWLDIPVIAEGVETFEQAEFLKSVGCEYAQGYYYSRPIPVSEFEKLPQYTTVNTSKNLIDKSFIEHSEFWTPTSPVNTLFNNLVSAAAIYEYHNGNLEIIRVNDAYFKLVGGNWNDLYAQSKSMKAVVYPEDWTIVKSMLDEVVKTKNISERQYRRLGAQGSIIWLKTRLRYLSGIASEKRFLLLGTLENITELKETSAFLDTIINEVPGGIFKIEITDTQTAHLLYGSDAYYQTLGYTPKDLKEKFDNNLLSLISHNELCRLRKVFHEALTKNDGMLRDDVQIICADKTLRWLNFNCSITQSHNHTILSGIQQDNTKRHELEAELRISEERFKIAFAQTSLEIFEFDMVNHVLHLTKKSAKIRNVAQAIPFSNQLTSFAATLHPESFFKLTQMFEALASDSKEAGALLRERQSDGQFHWMKVKLTAIKNQKNTPIKIIGVARDISEQKETQIQLKEERSQQKIQIGLNTTQKLNKNS